MAACLYRGLSRPNIGRLNKETNKRWVNKPRPNPGQKPLIQEGICYSVKIRKILQLLSIFKQFVPLNRTFGLY